MDFLKLQVWFLAKWSLHAWHCLNALMHFELLIRLLGMYSIEKVMQNSSIFTSTSKWQTN